MPDQRCVRMVAVIGRDAGHIRWVHFKNVDAFRRAGLEITHDYRLNWSQQNQEWLSGEHPISGQWAKEVEAMRNQPLSALPLAHGTSAESMCDDDWAELLRQHMAWRTEMRKYDPAFPLELT